MRSLDCVRVFATFSELWILTDKVLSTDMDRTRTCLQAKNCWGRDCVAAKTCLQQNTQISQLLQNYTAVFPEAAQKPLSEAKEE